MGFMESCGCPHASTVRIYTPWETSFGWDAASNSLASCDDIADQCLENGPCAVARDQVSRNPNPKLGQDCPAHMST